MGDSWWANSVKDNFIQVTRQDDHPKVHYGWMCPGKKLVHSTTSETAKCNPILRKFTQSGKKLWDRTRKHLGAKDPR